MFDRVISLIGENNFLKLKNKKILIVGVGGVGGYVLEALVRSGIENITIIDGDNIDITNLNRQIFTEQNNIGLRKVDVAKNRAILINPLLNIKSYDVFLTKENVRKYVLCDYDYIIDACDDVSVKIELIRFAKENNISIISSLGTGRKINPTKLEITTLNKTYNDPLARKLRNSLKKENIDLNIPVVFSGEEAVKTKDVVGSLIFVPASAGLIIANYVFLDIINN